MAPWAICAPTRGVNIDHIHASAPPDAQKTLGIFRVSDREQAPALDWGN